jgi:accessory gene regulator protein AgrB
LLATKSSDENHRLMKVLFGLAVVYVTMFKLLIQMKVSESLGMLVLLIFQCVTDTALFIFYLIIWMVFFTSINGIMGVN